MPPTCGACSPGRRSSPATVTATTGYRTPTRCVARPRCTARLATPSTTTRAIAAHELDSCIDNPVVLPDGRVESCGNFHGAPLATVADFLAVSIADVGAICVARTDRLLDPARSRGLPPFLAPDAGVNSGLMLAQYGQAAMVTENRRLAVPASADLADEHDAGGPRVAGLVGDPQAADRRDEPVPHPRRRAGRRLVGPRPAAAAAPPRPAPRRSPNSFVKRPATPGPTGGWRPSWPRSSTWLPTARSSPPPTARWTTPWPDGRTRPLEIVGVVLGYAQPLTFGAGGLWLTGAQIGH